MENENEGEKGNLLIKIQTIDNSFPVSIPSESTVGELKIKISMLYKIPIQSQRLIYQGKLIEDAQKLVDLKIGNGCVVHLVARVLEESNTNENTQNNNSGNNNNNTVQNIQTIFDEQFEEELSPVIQIPFRSNRRRGNIILPHFDVSECIEALYQNLLSLDNLQRCKKPFQKDTVNIPENKLLETFDFSKSKYEVGQWVDVKDTIDQWLEAQILKVQDNKAYVHYNGWGQRWDEWMDFTSAKMRNFKINTLQSPASFFNCPYPGIPCDSTIEPQERTIDSLYYLEKCKEHMDKLLKDIERIIELRKQKKETIFKDSYINDADREILFLATQMIPIMDRCGRMLSDISMQFSHLVVNPNFYPQILLGYERSELIEEIKKCENNTNKKGSVNIECQTSTSFPIKKDNNNNNQENIENKEQERSTTNNSNANIKNNNNINNNIMTNNNETHNQHHHSLSQSDALPRRLTYQEFSELMAKTNLGYSLSSSSSELPFIQRILGSFTQSDRIISQSSQVALIYEKDYLFPKINLQIPSILSSGEVLIMTGYSPFADQNFDIYLHTFPPREAEAQPQNIQNQAQNQNEHQYNPPNENNGTNENIQGQNVSEPEINPFEIINQMYKDKSTQTDT